MIEKKSSKIVILSIIIGLCVCLPTTFDLRVQPSIIKYADYSLKPQGTCVAHSWGLQLAQIVSNTNSLTRKQKTVLSSQQLIECISSKNQICHDATLDNIHKAIQFIEKYGLTTEQCIPNILLSRPRQFCPRQCDDGYKYPIVVKAKVQKHDNFQQMLTLLSNEQGTAAFIIVKVYNSMNYYSSENPSQLGQIDGDIFEYRVGQVVAWKNKGKTLVVRLGSGQGWGYNGFGNIQLGKHSNIIEEMYTINVLDELTAQRIYKNQQFDY